MSKDSLGGLNFKMINLNEKSNAVQEKENNYVIIANYFESDNVNVYIAYKDENDNENLFIINEFPIKQETDDIFKSLYFNFCSEKKILEFNDFFTHNKKFYAVFKYEQHNLISKFSKNTNTANFDVRIEILEKILIKFQILQEKLPNYVVSAVTCPENVMTDENNEVKIIYSLQNVFEYKKRIEDLSKKGDEKFLKKQSQKFIFENIDKVIHQMLAPEFKPFYNYGLRIISKKCKNNIYKSIPQMFVELKKAAVVAKNSTLFSYIKFKFNQRKSFYYGIIKTVLTMFVFILAGNIMFSNLTKGLKPTANPTAVEIGNEVYNTSVEENKNTEVEYESNVAEADKEDMSNVKLSPGLDLPYEDYIVQYDDTVESICKEYYQNVTYKTCVATFNNIGENDILTAGTILRLPNKTSIAYQLA